MRCGVARGLLYIAENQGGLDDSLHMQPGGGSYMIPGGLRDPAADVQGRSGPSAIMWVDGAVHLYQLKNARAWPEDTTTFVSLRRSGSDTSDGGRIVPAAVGYHFGRGRIVALSDADLLRNDVLRICRWDLGVAAVRMRNTPARRLGPAAARLRRIPFRRRREPPGHERGCSALPGRDRARPRDAGRRGGWTRASGGRGVAARGAQG